MWTLICQLWVCNRCGFSGRFSSSASMVAAMGNITMPSFSTGLLSVAISSSSATISEIRDAVLIKLKLKPLFCKNTAAIYKMCAQIAVHAR